MTPLDAPFAIQAHPIDPAPLVRALANPAAGAFVSFEGWARNLNEGHAVEALDYHAYDALCMKEAHRIIDEARQRFAILNSLCRHRTGRLAIGDMAVWVGVVAPHRDAAFAACRYLIDEIKGRLPIWKREHYLPDADGKPIEPQWVNCAHCAQHFHPAHTDN